MSFSALYEYSHGEFQDVTRVMLNAAGVDSVWIVDPNGVKIAGHTIELWDAEPGGTQLLEDVDYSLTFLDTGKTAAEGVDIWAGYQVLNVAYQGIPLYITARIIGGYTQYSSGRIIFDAPAGDQWVTKWDTGRMEIIQVQSEESIPNPALSTFSVPFAPGTIPLVTGSTRGATNRSISFSDQTNESFTAYRFTADTGADATTRFGWLAVGQWK